MAKQPLTAGINDVCSVNSSRNLFLHSARAEVNEAEQERVNNQHKSCGSKYTLLRPFVSLLPVRYAMFKYNVWTWNTNIWLVVIATVFPLCSIYHQLLLYSTTVWFAPRLWLIKTACCHFVLAKENNLCRTLLFQLTSTSRNINSTSMSPLFAFKHWGSLQISVLTYYRNYAALMIKKKKKKWISSNLLGVFFASLNLLLVLDVHTVIHPLCV